MTTFNEYDSVVFTDVKGNQIDTFVVYDTDAVTGLTHINYMDLKVPAHCLRLHANSLEVNHVPVSDLYSLELLRRLKAKFSHPDKRENKTRPVIHALNALPKAS